MTKKDYELIAEVFGYHRKQYGGRTDSVTVELVNDLADALAKQNPKFNRNKFLASCGLSNENNGQKLISIEVVA